MSSKAAKKIKCGYRQYHRIRICEPGHCLSLKTWAHDKAHGGDKDAQQWLANKERKGR